MRFSSLALLLPAAMSVFFGLLWISMKLVDEHILRAAYRDVSFDLLGYALLLLVFYDAKNWWGGRRDPY